jgi:hypothetical protein
MFNRTQQAIGLIGGFTLAELVALFRDTVVSDDRRQIIIELYGAGQDKRDIPGLDAIDLADVEQLRDWASRH